MTIRRPSNARSLGAVVLGLALAAGLTAPASADGPDQLTSYAPDNPLGPSTPVISPALLGSEGRVSVFVQTSGTSALEVSKKAKSTSAVKDRVAEIDKSAAAIESEAKSSDADAEVLYVSHYTVPGIALSLNADSIAMIAELDDVVKVSAITRHSVELPDANMTPSNVNSDALVNALEAWGIGGTTGEGINIAVIDTGIDYTHSDFGGPGTPADYATALAASDMSNAALYDSAKILGGKDFAGPTYNPSPGDVPVDPVPVPDDNPLDGPGGGHGTHVAATAAGYGVTADGQTYAGGYAAIDEGTFRSMIVAPGSAPEAGLYSLKVFGDLGGTTDLTGAAIDWVGEAIANGKSINVINLSLGSDFGAVDDPDNAKIAALMDFGVLPVISSGNADDIIDVGGSPGNTARSLTVAASASGSSLMDAVTVTAPADVAGVVPAQYSVSMPGPYDVTASVVALSDPANLEACSAFSPTDAAAVAGKIVWIEWNDAQITCGSGTRFTNASNAGAVGVVLTSTLNSFESGISGNAVIPGAQITADKTAALRPALAAGTLSVQLSSASWGTLPSTDPTRVDTMASFSSRGEHGSYNDIVKPDVSAPGVGIISAASGTGDQATVKSGTSMSAPLTAGVAALVFQSHAGWTPDQVKAQIINTATHDVSTADATPIVYAPARAGTGRIDALAAVTNQVTVASDDSGGLVTASFGVVEVGQAGVSQTRTLTVTNSGASAATYDVAYLARTTTPGVSYTVSPSTVTVPGNGTATLTVTLNVPDATALRHTIDSTMETDQGGLTRSYVTDASGVLELTPTTEGASDLRVAVFSAPKPTSDVHATTFELADATTTTGNLELTGYGFAGGPAADAYNSTVVPLQLGVTDETLTFPAGSAAKTLASLDVTAIGASSTAPQLATPEDGILTFGVVMQGPWGRILPHSIPIVSIDLDQDGTEDFYTYLTSYSDTVDVFVAVTVDSRTDVVVDVWPANFSQADTNIFDTNVVTLPVSLASLGYDASSTATTLNYQVLTISDFAIRPADQPDNNLVDITDVASFDVYAPAVWFGDTTEEAVTYADATGHFPVNVPGNTGDAAAFADTPAPQILLLHLNNAVGSMVDIIPVTIRGVTPTITPTSTPSGGATDPSSSTTPGEAGGAGGLANTGTDGIVFYVILGLLLVSAGTGLVVARKRRITTD